MLKKLCLTLLSFTSFFLIAPQTSQAQDFPPLILTFSSDLAALSLADVEAQETEALFTWQVLEMTAGYSLQLQTYQGNRWLPLLPQAAEPLPALGSATLPIQHSLSFAPPTYRLIVLDSAAQIVDERSLIIPYLVEENPPTPSIEVFSANLNDLSAATFISDDNPLIVTWEIANRLPTSNLRFEQVLDDGSLSSLERPRPLRWIASQGSGQIFPLIPNGASQIRLRLSIVDLTTDTLLDEAFIDLPVAAGASSPGSKPTMEGAGGNSGGFIAGEGVPPALFATVSPLSATYGEAISIHWRMADLRSFSVSVVLGSGSPIEIINSREESGTFTYTLPSGDYTAAYFTLTATSSAGISRSRTDTVSIH